MGGFVWRNNQKIISSICLIYIIVYVVIKVWFNPNYEPFSQGEKIVRIRDVIASKGLMEITFRKPLLDEGDEIVRYEIILNNDKNVLIGKKILTEYLGQDLVKYTINDNVIENFINTNIDNSNNLIPDVLGEYIHDDSLPEHRIYRPKIN